MDGIMKVDCGMVSHVANSLQLLFSYFTLTLNDGETRIQFQTRPGLGPGDPLRSWLAVDHPHHP